MRKLIPYILFLGLTNCVSVKIGNPSVKKSNRYSYTSPSKDFYRIKDEAVDLAWISQKTSSTLSIKSKCIKNNDTDLESWLMELTSSFKNGELVTSERFKYNNRKAIRAEIKTSLEGFDNQIALTSFIKNSCQYILALTASPQNYQNDITVYDKFLTSFKAW